MAGRSRGILMFALIFGGVGALFLLWGIGVNVGKWWPVFFAAIGFASFVRGMNEIAHVVFGLLLIGWSAAGIVCLHHAEIGIDHVLPFFIGAFILWMPLAWMLGRLISTDRK
jgi:hypothetical protein